MNKPETIPPAKYILESFEPTNRIAVLALNRDFRETVQRIISAEKAASPEFQAWLRHKNASGSDIYVTWNRTGWFVIEVLIDQEVVRNGKADSEPWRFYDLGHGYCTYDFFDQCPHRVACARCGFYRPKNSAAALFLEGKNNLLRLQQDIPLTEAEANAVEDGVNAFEKLLAQLTDVPTPAGPTPRQLQSGLVQIEPTKDRRE
jgi:hypothetical protein